MTTQGLLLFRKWDVSQIEIKDVGLKTAISLKETILPMHFGRAALKRCLLYTSPSPRDKRQSRMPSSA